MKSYNKAWRRPATYTDTYPATDAQVYSEFTVVVAMALRKYLRK